MWAAGPSLAAGLFVRREPERESPQSKGQRLPAMPRAAVNAPQLREPPLICHDIWVVSAKRAMRITTRGYACGIVGENTHAPAAVAYGELDDAIR